MQKRYDLVVYRKIDQANLHCYRLLTLNIELERKKLKTLTTDVNNVVALYMQNPELEAMGKKRNELRLEIRFMAKGIPVTEPQSLDDLPTDTMSEQQSVAYMQLLKRAYRQVAFILHPDRGGDTEAFQDLQEAYAAQDLNRINAIYISLTKSRDIYWQSSDEGLDWASTELHLVSTRLYKLQSSALFKVVRCHMAGGFEKAHSFMHQHLVQEIGRLQSELHYLRTKNENQNQI